VASNNNEVYEKKAEEEEEDTYINIWKNNLIYLNPLLPTPVQEGQWPSSDYRSQVMHV
jgi:hypothetical protein